MKVPFQAIALWSGSIEPRVCLQTHSGARHLASFILHWLFDKIHARGKPNLEEGI